MVQSLALKKTFARYWDFSIPSAEVRPTQISKVCSLYLICTWSCIYTSSQINTALQLALMAQTTITPILPPSLVLPVEPLQFVLHPSWAVCKFWCPPSQVGGCDDNCLEWSFIRLFKRRCAYYIRASKAEATSILTYLILHRYTAALLRWFICLCKALNDNDEEMNGR